MNAKLTPRRWLTSSLAGLALMSMVGACTGTPEVPVPTPTVSETPEVEPSKTPAPDPELPIVWPLTGVQTTDLVEQPAVAVKIENTAAARPQSGLNQADVVWETIIEFDVSRFLAVFDSQTPQAVGPIRSVRPIDMRIYAPLEPVFAFSGGQAGILKDMRATQGVAVDENTGGGTMWREGSRRAPHNLYGSVEKMRAVGKSLPPVTEQFTFAADLDSASAYALGEATTNISLNMSPAAKPQWDWSEQAMAWQRSEGNNAATDAEGKRLEATNVVVLEAKTVDSGYKAQNNAMVPDNVLEGTGDALVATGGKTLAGTWSKADKNSPVLLHMEGQVPLDLAPGNTWVEVLPSPSGSFTLTP